jgi:hypothetical protein
MLVVIHTPWKRLMFRKFQNLSLTKKVEWKRLHQEMKDMNQKIFPGLFRENGSVDLIALANRAQRKHR